MPERAQGLEPLLWTKKFPKAAPTAENDNVVPITSGKEERNQNMKRPNETVPFDVDLETPCHLFECFKIAFGRCKSTRSFATSVLMLEGELVTSGAH